MKASKHEPFASTTPIHAPDRDLFGVLESVEPTGLQDGLILVQVSGMRRLVDEGRLPDRQGLIGQEVTIIHAAGSWGARARA